jgi:RHS repeat-associated protein
VSDNSITSCTQPGGYVAAAGDCNDSNAAINPNITWFYDGDGDGFGTAATQTQSCTQPANYVSNLSDCNDADASLNPNTVWYLDADADGYGTSATTTNRCTQPTGYVRNASDYNDGTANITNIAPSTFYRDADNDTFGSPGVTVFYSVKPTGYVTNNTDCNDGDATLNPNTIWYRDADGDTFGATTPTLAQCTQPAGYVRNSSDYNDTTVNITNIAPSTFYRDADNDTFGNAGVTVLYSVKPAGYVTNNTDCNDGDATLNPTTIWYRDADGDTFGATTPTLAQCTQPAGYVRNALDYNDGTANITNIAPSTFYRDADNDTFGNAGVTIFYSVKPAGYVTNNTDCNDGDATLNPTTIWYRDADGDSFGATTPTLTQCIQPAGYVRNSSDYNDGTANITNIAPSTFYRDADADTFGSPTVTVSYSVKPAGYVTNNTDCNDGDATVNPNTIWYRDADGDTFGATTPTLAQCTQPAGYVRNSSDYNDTTANITNIAPSTFYRDADADTFGNAGVTVSYSVKPAGYVTNNTDCNDGDATLNPNTIWYRDADGDSFGATTPTLVQCTQPAGYVRNSSDYNDTTVNITNIAPSTFYRDADADTFGSPTVTVFYSVKPAGYVTNSTDCNDGDATINPNTKWYADNDLDGLGDPLTFVQQCTAPAGNYVRDNTDNCPALPGTSSDCTNITTPSADYNYIITKTYKEPTATIVTAPAANQVQTNITYFDGLGRPMQQIANKQSSSGKDIITHVGYDDYGRQVQEYLPYVASSTNMVFEANAAVNTAAFYNTAKYENTSNPFSQKLLEASPLSRVIKQAAPGTSWAMDGGHEIKIGYQTNTSNEVKLYKATTTWTAGSGLYEIAFSDAGNYVANELDKTITYDENTSANPVESSGSTVEFKNKEGQVILKRTYDAGVKHDTYYVYDIYGNLTYVLPPGAEGVISTDILNNLCYQYKYDNRNRLVEKKLPGKQWELIVYDKLDRPVATGPAFSPFKDDTAVGWLITKYDAYSRPVYTGWSSQAVSSAARYSLQTAQNAVTGVLYETKQTSGTIDGIAAYYSNAVAPTSFKLLTVNYYDDYSFRDPPTVATTVEGQPVLANVKGLATGSWTRALSTASSLAGEINIIVYDVKARPIRTYTQNHLGGYTYTDSNLDFGGKTLYTISKHKRTSGDTELTVKEVFTYSPQDRLLTHTNQINGGAIQLMAANTYDELGQLTSKNVGNSTGAPLQKVDFNYNIRGWLTEINKTANLQQGSDAKDLFAFKINYNTTQAGITGVNALYNGNISEILWKTGSDALDRGYGYKYDNLNRLKNAIYEKSGLTTDAYDENLTYDKNGNIISLVRKGDIDPQVGIIEIDNLAYTYPANSNQLGKVTDNANNSSGFNDVNKTGDDYTYDANGNMITDKNKNITAITYNQLNLPKKITFGTTGTIEYIYNAAGQKLEKIVTEGTVTTNTNYLGGFQYKNNVLEFFPTAEGYVKNTAGALSYVFQYKDHLGNIRLSYAKNPTTQVLEIIEENNYYPFGLKHKGYNDYVVTGNKYKFQGQERQDELGLGWDSFKYRNYDYAIARFMSIDPLTEKYRDWGPYVFSGNRVVDAREIEGLEPDILFGSEKDALKNFGQQYNGKSIKQGVEYGTNVYRTTAADGGTYYYYEEPNVGNAASVKYPSTLFNEGERVSTVHAHGEYLEEYDNNNFSPPDKENADKRGVDNHIVTPDGSLKKYDVKTKKETVIDTNMPSDPKDPERKNKVAPNENPSPVKTKPIEPKKVDAKPDPQYHHGRIM